MTGAAVPTPCSAARGSVRTVETFAAERRLGFLGHFRTFPPGCTPPPRPPSDLAGDDRLSAFVHMDVLDDDGLLTSRAQPLQRRRALLATADFVL